MSSIDFSKLSDFSYILDANPPYQFAGLWPLFVFFTALIIGSILLSVFRLQEWQESYKKNLITPLWVGGAVGLLLLFARNQSIPYLSSRALLLVVILAFFIWFGYNLLVARKKTDEAKILYKQREKLTKYLPKKKQ